MFWVWFWEFGIYSLGVGFRFEGLRFFEHRLAVQIYDPLVRFVLNGSDPVFWFIEQLIFVRCLWPM